MKLILVFIILWSDAFGSSLGKRATKTLEIDPELEKEFERKELEQKQLARDLERKRDEEIKKKEQEKIVQELKEISKKNEIKTPPPKPQVAPVVTEPKIELPKPVIKYEPKKAEKFRQGLKVLPKRGDPFRKSPGQNQLKSSSWTAPAGGGASSVIPCKDEAAIGEHRLLHMKQDHVFVYTPRLSCRESVENCEVNYTNNKMKIGYRCYWNDQLVFWKEAKE